MSNQAPRFNSDNPHWDPNWDFDYAGGDPGYSDRDYIEMPDIPDINDLKKLGGRGARKRPKTRREREQPVKGRPRNSRTDPINPEGGFNPFEPEVDDWKEVVWDEFINTRDVLSPASPFRFEAPGPKPRPWFPGDPVDPNNPDHPERPPDFPSDPDICGLGLLPYNSYGGDHGSGSILVQFGIYCDGRKIGRKSQYFKHGLAAEYRLHGFSLSPTTEPVYARNTAYGWNGGLPWNSTEEIIVMEYTSKMIEGFKSTSIVYEYSEFWPLGDDGNEKGPVYWSSPQFSALYECEVGFQSKTEPETVDPKKYNRGDEMPCSWQKNEVSYALPELKIGNQKIGGNSINIDDGLIPFADFVIKSMAMMHQGMGLDLLDDIEFPKDITKKNENKIKHKSLAELSQWQFDNVTSLVGLPVKNTLTNLANDTKDLVFKNNQDILSAIYHQQRESDQDLWVIEQYAVKIAQQLEAITQIGLKTEADMDMIVKEAGFKWKWEKRERMSQYKIGMKDDDEETGVIELFKGGKITYPVRVWNDQLDARQIAMKTNLYGQIAAQAQMVKIDPDPKKDIPGYDTRKRMMRKDDENWKEYAKTINNPEVGVISGSISPKIEEYKVKGIAASPIEQPTSGLTLFMKERSKKKAATSPQPSTPSTPGGNGS